VKRRTPVRHLEHHACELLREGEKHSVYINGRKDRVTAVPRHRELNEFLARKTCRDLDIPEP
jgi:hypothetical protein